MDSCVYNKDFIGLIVYWSVICQQTGVFHLINDKWKGCIKNILTSTVNFPLSSSERRGSSWGWSLTIPSLRRVSWRKQTTAGEVKLCYYNRPSNCGKFVSEQWRITVYAKRVSVCKVSMTFSPPRRLCGSFLNLVRPNLGGVIFMYTFIWDQSTWNL